MTANLIAAFAFRKSKTPSALRRKSAKVSVLVKLHPADYNRALGLARKMGIKFAEFGALALHLGCVEAAKLCK
ncbi:hypothetical protein [Burkholderia sp. L27(2015)]|uniref:hypothetical protein n=1 Tax=Burkholderia sp. L27(2015) TaxID=1641858 RepID=UPI00131CA7F0|nr:hypothetical protein [Burkholderia sp. L27(2015)]